MMTSKRAATLVMILISVYTLRLVYSGELSYYIHPRYTLWVIGAAVATLAAVALMFFYRKSIHDDIEGGRKSIFFVIAVLLAALVLPAMPLQSLTASQRFQPGAPLGPSASYLLASPVDINAPDLTIREWIILLYKKGADPCFVPGPRHRCHRVSLSGHRQKLLCLEIRDYLLHRRRHSGRGSKSCIHGRQASRRTTGCASSARSRS